MPETLKLNTTLPDSIPSVVCIDKTFNTEYVGFNAVERSLCRLLMAERQMQSSESEDALFKAVEKILEDRKAEKSS